MKEKSQMTNVAILGMGKIGQSLLAAFANVPEMKAKFSVTHLWNRSPEVFQDIEIPPSASIYHQIEDLLPHLSTIDLVVECSHSSVVKKYASAILKETDLFVSSPTVFADPDFLAETQGLLAHSKGECYIGLGASMGVWEIIRLDMEGQIKSLEVEMLKHPDSFKLPGKAEQEKQQLAREKEGDRRLASGTVGQVNVLAPQNTNTMSLYALAASRLGFSGCQARITANRDLDSHIVRCVVETHSGLELSLVRDNPAGHGQVTGSATFSSFLNSVKHHASGIRYNGFVFC